METHPRVSLANPARRYRSCVVGVPTQIEACLSHAPPRSKHASTSRKFLRERTAKMADSVATIITRTATLRLISVSLVQTVGPKMITCRSTLMRSRTPFANAPSRTPACHVRPLIRERGGPRVTFDTLVHDFSPIAYRSRDSLSCFT